MWRSRNSGDHLAIASPSYDAQRAIQREVNTNLQAPFVSASRFPHDLFDLRDLEASSAAQIAQRWSNCQLQPDYKDFTRQWDRAADRAKAGTEFRYALLYQEIEILQWMADRRGIALKHEDAVSCEY